jgi:hypothetical protein
VIIAAFVTAVVALAISGVSYRRQGKHDQRNSFLAVPSGRSDENAVHKSTLNSFDQKIAILGDTAAAGHLFAERARTRLSSSLTTEDLGAAYADLRRASDLGDRSAPTALELARLRSPRCLLNRPDEREMTALLDFVTSVLPPNSVLGTMAEAERLIARGVPASDTEAPILDLADVYAEYRPLARAILIANIKGAVTVGHVDELNRYPTSDPRIRGLDLLVDPQSTADEPTRHYMQTTLDSRSNPPDGDFCTWYVAELLALLNGELRPAHGVAAELGISLNSARNRAITF